MEMRTAKNLEEALRTPGATWLGGATDFMPLLKNQVRDDENLVLVRPVGDNEFGSFLGFETLTLCHFDTSCLEVSLLSPDERAWLNAYNAHVCEVLSPRLPAEVAAWLRDQTRAV